MSEPVTREQQEGWLHAAATGVAFVLGLMLLLSAAAIAGLLLGLLVST